MDVKIATFDIEADNYIKPFLIAFYDGDLLLFFEGEDCVSEFCEFLLKNIKRYSQYRIYAHYGGGYDFQFLLEEFAKRNLKFNVLIQNSNIIYFSVEKGKRYLKFYDSFAILPVSLEDLTKSFKVEHEKIALDRSRIYEIYKKDRQLVLKYIEHDVKGLYEVLQKFYQIIEDLGGEVKRTIASTAFRILRNYLERKQKIPPCIKRFREAYYGGRVEVFIRYGRDLYYYDFNSLYPYVMAKYEYPVSPPIKEKPEYFEDYECGIVLATVEVKDCFIPPLPLKIENKLIFPVGRFTNWFVLPELKNALEKDLISDLKIHELYVFESEKLFEEFVKDLYKRRMKAKEEGNKTLDLVFKLLLNSSYGKFGEKEEKEKIKKITEDEHDLLFKYPLYNEEAGLIKVTQKANLRHINIPIASHITAYARIELFNKMYELLEKGYKVYYCDTDSIITNAKLPSGKELGQLKLEYEIEEGVFYAPKMYALKLKNGEEVVKSKGFPAKLVTYQDVYNAVFNNEKFVKKFEKFGKLKESLRRFDKFYSLFEMEKGIRSDYDKRIVIDGINTRPIKIGVDL